MRGARPSHSPLPASGPPIRFSRGPVLPGFVWGLLAVASAAVAVLHGVEAEINAFQQPLSFYVHGRHGWLLPLALGAFGLSAMVLAIDFSRASDTTRAARWLTPFGLGMMVAALVPADRWFPWEGPVSVGGAIHALVAVVAPPLLLGAMWWLRARHWSSRATGLANALALTYLAGLIASAVSLGLGFFLDRAPPLIGLAERVLALAAVGWLALAARPPDIEPPTPRPR